MVLSNDELTRQSFVLAVFHRHENSFAPQKVVFKADVANDDLDQRSSGTNPVGNWCSMALSPVTVSSTGALVKSKPT